jgi:predicted DNA-binding transcriptional regulator AlpA
MNTPTFGRARVARKTSPEERYIDYDGLAEKGVRFCRNHLRRLWTRDEFPRPVRLSPRKLVWPESAIDHWLAEKRRQAEMKSA